MTRWEYKIASSIEDIHTIGALDALGADGWELVGFDGRGIAFFKRPIAPATGSGVFGAVTSTPPAPKPVAAPAAPRPAVTVPVKK